MRILGIDLGRRRVGLALSDPSGVLATPLETLDGRDRDALVAQLRSRVRELEVEEVVVGLPRRTDGTLGPEALAAQSFAERLARSLGLPIHLEDERLTTVQAHRSMQEAGARGAERRKAVDRVAAVLILQTFLDRRQPRAEDPW
jgi:putative Holliday junction resolvase